MQFIKKYKKTSICLGLLFFFVFYEVIPELQGDKIFLLTRLVYSRPKLAKEIIVKTHVLSNEQVGELFLYPDKEPIPLQNKAFMPKQGDSNQPTHPNLVVRIQQMGPWVGGVILYTIDQRSIRGKIHALDLGTVGGKPTDFQNFVVPLDDNSIGAWMDPEGYPEITYQWSELYGCW